MTETKETLLINQLKNVRTCIDNAYQMIDKLKKNQQTIVNELYQTCVHEWQCDPSIYSEHTEFICKKCGLYK